jgi:conjugative relaxase-like TrwC/TraI family protein
MLTIAAIRGDGSYYITVGMDDYYLRPGEAIGVWFGSGAKTLGVSGNFDPAEYKHLMAGFSPDGSVAYFKNSGTESRRSGIDLTFSAPKSVSELWAASSGIANLEAIIREANWAAVRRTMQHLQEQAAFGRDGLGGQARVKVELLLCGFEHGSNRNRDPQLHIHVVAVNTGVRRGKYKTIASHELYKWKMAAGAIYRAELAHQLRTRLGIDLVAKSTWFEVRGVPDSLVSAGSSRRKEIVAALEAAGMGGAKAAMRAARDTRAPKDLLPRAELFEMWSQLAKAHGFGPEKVQALLRPGLTRVPDKVPPSLVTNAVEQLLERHSFFSERELVRGVAERTQALGIAVDTILRDVRTGLEQLVAVGELGGERQFTTRENLELERNLIAKAVLGRGLPRCMVPESIVRQILSEIDLSPEQANAVRHITTRPGTIQIIHGLAGTGKSTAMATARKIFEAGGFKLIGCALSGKASEELELSSGIRSFTIAKLLKEWKKPKPDVPRPDSRTVLVIDESSMIGTRRLAELLDLAEAAQAKVVAVGDSRQLPAIEAGAPFPALCRFLGMASMNDIRRQLSQWGRELVREFADGDVRKAVAVLDQKGLLKVASSDEAASRALLADWSKEKDPRESIILAGTREEVDWLNREAQKIRREASPRPPNRHEICGREYFEGDRVLFVRNDRKLGVKNGSFGTLLGVRDGSAVIELDGTHKRVFIPLNHEHLRLGFATTTHKSQGATYLRTYVRVSDAMQSREATYVQVSRARQWTKLYLSREQAGEKGFSAVIRAMERSEAKTNAIDLAGWSPDSHPASGPARDRERDRGVSPAL